MLGVPGWRLALAMTACLSLGIAAATWPAKEGTGGFADDVWHNSCTIPRTSLCFTNI